MEKELQTSIVHYRRFGEGQRFTNKAKQTLSEGIVPAFHMSRFPASFPTSICCSAANHLLIGGSKILEAMVHTVGWGKSFPQATARPFASVSDCISGPLDGFGGIPDLTLVGLLGDKGPQFVQFQIRTSPGAATRRGMQRTVE